jgi:hypothetical protein
LPRSVLSPPPRLLCAPGSCGELGLLAGSSRRETHWRSGLRSSSRNLWGNCVGARVETPRGPDSTQRGFSSRLAAQFHFRGEPFGPSRTRLRPEELVIYASRPAFAAARGGRHQLPPAIPRSPGIIPAALSSGISTLRAALVLFRLKMHRCNHNLVSIMTEQQYGSFIHMFT